MSDGMNWEAVIAGAVSGLGAGIVASLIAPWVQLAVERRRETRIHRRQLISHWRGLVARHHNPRKADSHIVDDPDFLSLRAHLRPEVRHRLDLEPGTEARPLRVTTNVRGVRVNEDLDIITQEIDRLEREWKLQ